MTQEELSAIEARVKDWRNSAGVFRTDAENLLDYIRELEKRVVNAQEDES